MLSFYQTIDWATTGSMLAGIGTIFGGGAVIYAARKGSDTFNQWRRQKSEERRIVLAEQVLTLAYRVRRAIDTIRSPVLWRAEKEEVIAGLIRDGFVKDDTEIQHREWLATAGAAFARAKSSQPVWDSLVEILPTAKAIFGESIETRLEQLWKERNKVLAAAQRHADLYRRRDPTDPAEAERMWETQNSIEAVIWAGAGRDGVDAVADAVDNIIAGLETDLLPIIRDETRFGINRPAE